VLGRDKQSSRLVSMAHIEVTGTGFRDLSLGFHKSMPQSLGLTEIRHSRDFLDRDAGFTYEGVGR
jgi:hypothetical protein